MPEGGGCFWQGMGWGFDCLCWPWDRAFDWSCSPRGGDIWIFPRLTWKYLTADSDEKDWDRTCFLLPCFTHAPYSLERSGNHGGQWEQAKARWISLFRLQISFVLAYFYQLNLRYCGIKVNRSKEQPRRLLQSTTFLAPWSCRWQVATCTCTSKHEVWITIQCIAVRLS